MDSCPQNSEVAESQFTMCWLAILFIATSQVAASWELEMHIDGYANEKLQSEGQWDADTCSGCTMGIRGIKAEA